MNAVTTTESTALTLPERARTAIALRVTEEELKALAAKTADIVEITNAAARDQVHACRMTLKRQRVDIETAGELARDDANKFAKAVITETNRLKGLIEPEEQRLNDLQIAWDKAREADKQARAEAERKRLADIQSRLSAIRAWPQSALNQPAILVEQKLRNAAEFVVGEDFGEFQEEAKLAVEVSRQSIAQTLADRLAFEEEQVRLRAEREELARQKQAQEAAAQLERDRIAREEADAKARRDEEERAHQEKLRLEREEQDAQAAARQAIIDQQRAAQVAADNQRQSQLNEEHARQVATLRAQQEKLDEERRQIEETKRAEREAREAEEARQAEIARLVALEPPAALDMVEVLAQQFGVPAAMALGWVQAVEWTMITLETGRAT